MTDTTIINLAAGLDRALAWHEGGSVRYLVADISAARETAQREAPALNLALAIDISGSMAGDKIDAARRAALAVVSVVTARNRLSLVAFDNKAELLMNARPMDEAGRAAATNAIRGLTARGGTNLFDGWVLAAERVATAMVADRAASHRVLLLSDGHANDGLTDRGQIAGHVGALLERGVLTSALGIGDGYARPSRRASWRFLSLTPARRTWCCRTSAAACLSPMSWATASVVLHADKLKDARYS